MVPFWIIVVATGATLGVHRQPVETAEDAARALAPFAGPLAELLFALGLLGSALIAVPVLVTTNAYVTASVFNWRRSLNEPLSFATLPFYSVLLGSLTFGATTQLLNIEPMQMLFLASIFEGLGTPVLLVLLLQIATSPRVMGEYRITGWMASVAWVVTGIVTLAGLAFLVEEIS